MLQDSSGRGLVPRCLRQDLEGFDPSQWFGFWTVGEWFDQMPEEELREDVAFGQVAVGMVVPHRSRHPRPVRRCRLPCAPV